MKSIEICAGAGGLSLGLEMSNFEHLLLLENNKKCCETLKINKPDWNVICEDVNKFDIIDYMKKNKLKKGVCDLLCGGIPCQPFSNAGLRKGFDDVRANVFETFLYFIEKIQPKIFLIENVKGMLTLNKGEIFKEIISKLEEKKYKIFHKVLNANDFNVAQKRERLFIVGVDKRLINKDFTSFISIF